MTSDFEKKEKIISAATSLFSRFGLEKTTMEDIAKAAKKGKSLAAVLPPVKDEPPHRRETDPPNRKFITSKIAV